MSYPTNEDVYLKLIRRFLNAEEDGEAFCQEFMWMWRMDRDEEYAKSGAWPERYDLQIAGAYDRGELTEEEFRRRWVELWGYAEYEPLVEMLGRIFTACDCFSPMPELGHEIDEVQLRGEVSEMIASYEVTKARRG